LGSRGARPQGSRSYSSDTNITLRVLQPSWWVHGDVPGSGMEMGVVEGSPLSSPSVGISGV